MFCGVEAPPTHPVLFGSWYYDSAYRLYVWFAAPPRAGGSGRSRGRGRGQITRSLPEGPRVPGPFPLPRARTGPFWH